MKESNWHSFERDVAYLNDSHDMLTQLNAEVFDCDARKRSTIRTPAAVISFIRLLATSAESYRIWWRHYQTVDTPRRGWQRVRLFFKRHL